MRSDQMTRAHGYVHVTGQSRDRANRENLHTLELCATNLVMISKITRSVAA